MIEDKSLFHYGKIYNKLLDPLIRPARQILIDHIPAGSSVLDVGCGTGLLCFGLKREKGCEVVGIDLSTRMLEYAMSINSYEDVKFLHQDATNMKDIQNDSFDYVILLNVIHELWSHEQLSVIKESMRVGRNVAIFDSNVPLPKNVSGLIKRLIEVTFGVDHYGQFGDYPSAGGISGILDRAGINSKIKDQFTFSQGCNHLVLVSKDVA